MPQAPSLPAEGRAGAKTQRQELELLLNVQALAVSKKCWHGKSGNEERCLHWKVT